MADFIGILLTIDAIFTWAFASLVYKFGLQKIEAPQALLPRLLFVTLFTFAISLFFGNYLIFTGLNFQQLIDYDIACIISGVTVYSSTFRIFINSNLKNHLLFTPINVY